MDDIGQKQSHFGINFYGVMAVMILITFALGLCVGTCLGVFVMRGLVIPRAQIATPAAQTPQPENPEGGPDVVPDPTPLHARRVRTSSYYTTVNGECVHSNLHCQNLVGKPVKTWRMCINCRRTEESGSG